MARFRQIPVGLPGQWFDGHHPEVAGLWVLLMTDPRAGMTGCFKVSRAEIWGELGIPEAEVRTMLEALQEHLLYRDRWVALRRFAQYQGKGAKWQAGVTAEMRDKRVPGDVAAFALGHAPCPRSVDTAQDAPCDAPCDAPSQTAPAEREREREREQEREQERESAVPLPPPPRPSKALGTQAAADAVIAHWMEAFDHPRYKADMGDVIAVQNALRTGWTVEELQRSITGYTHDRWQGRRKMTAHNLDVLLRDSKHIERGLELGEGAADGLEGGSVLQADDAAGSDFPV